MIKQTNYKEVFEGRDDKILRLSAPFAFQTPSHQRMKRPSLYSITMAREKKMGGEGVSKKIAMSSSNTQIHLFFLP